ncbi:MAG: DMT family transporter [archaeon]
MKTETSALMQFLIAQLLFGFIPIVVRFGSGIGSFSLAFFRILITALALGAFFLLARQTFAPFKEERGRLLLFGAVHGFIILGYFLAIQHLSIANAVLLLYSASIWMVVFSWLLLKEKLTARTITALCIALAGVVLVLDPSQMFSFNNVLGSVAGLLAGVGFGWVYVASKQFKTYDKVSLTFWQNLIALPFLLPFLLFIPLQFKTADIGLLLILGVVCTALPFILIFKSLEKLSGQKAGVLILLDILFPVVFAILFFKELPSLMAILGGLLIIGGVLLVTLEKKQEKH